MNDYRYRKENGALWSWCFVGLKKKALAAGSQAMLGSINGGSLKRLFLGKTQSEVDRACLLKRVENFHSSPK